MARVTAVSQAFTQRLLLDADAKQAERHERNRRQAPPRAENSDVAATYKRAVSEKILGLSRLS